MKVYNIISNNTYKKHCLNSFSRYPRHTEQFAGSFRSFAASKRQTKNSAVTFATVLYQNILYIDPRIGKHTGNS